MGQMQFKFFFISIRKNTKGFHTKLTITSAIDSLLLLDAET